MQLRKQESKEETQGGILIEQQNEHLISNMVDIILLEQIMKHIKISIHIIMTHSQQTMTVLGDHWKDTKILVHMRMFTTVKSHMEMKTFQILFTVNQNTLRAKVGNKSSRAISSGCSFFIPRHYVYTKHSTLCCGMYDTQYLPLKTVTVHRCSQSA